MQHHGRVLCRIVLEWEMGKLACRDRVQSLVWMQSTSQPDTSEERRAWSRQLLTTSWLFGRGVISTFSWGLQFFLFVNATGLLKNWKKQHFICSNLTLFIVPFFLPFFFSSFFLFFFLLCFSFFFSFFSLGATAHQPPSNDAPVVWRSEWAKFSEIRAAFRCPSFLVFFSFKSKLWRLNEVSFCSNITQNNKPVLPGSCRNEDTTCYCIMENCS